MRYHRYSRSAAGAPATLLRSRQQQHRSLNRGSLAARRFDVRSLAVQTRNNQDQRRQAGGFPNTSHDLRQFLEPIGNSTYGGLWAEILQNGSLESGLCSASNVARMIRDEPGLGERVKVGIAVAMGAIRCEAREPVRGQAWRCDRTPGNLCDIGLPGQGTGIKQQIFLPAQRELRYQGSIYVKHLSGRGEIEISVSQSEIIRRTCSANRSKRGCRRVEEVSIHYRSQAGSACAGGARGFHYPGGGRRTSAN